VRGLSTGSRNALLGLLVALAVVVWIVAPQGSSGDPSGPAPASVAVADLPSQAAHTLALIDAGGPFPYSRDGVTFENRERLLPDQPRGYYREYTVPTPGSSDRGARRIIVGRDGTAYWTADHYASFSRIRR
jgi:ribonuclease T1